MAQLCMGGSILMMMECKSQDGKRKANKQKIGKFFIHQPINLPIRYGKVNGVYTVFLKKKYCIFKREYNID